MSNFQNSNGNRRSFLRSPSTLMLCLAGSACAQEPAEDESDEPALQLPETGAGGSTTSEADHTGGRTDGTDGVGGDPPSSGGAGDDTSSGGQGPAGNSGGTSPSGGTPSFGCAGKGYLICEDFEDADPGQIPSGWEKHGEESGVSVEFANSGEKSLWLGAIARWERRIYTDASVLGSAHWGRIFYRVQLPVPEAFVHSTIVALRGVGPNVGEAEYRVVDTVKAQGENANHQFLYNVQPQGPEFGQGTDYDYQFEDSWHCAEWFIDSSDQSYALYLDGDEVMSFTRGAGNYSNAEIPDSFSELRIGWINYQEAPPGFTAWLDDLALHDERIGCEP